MGGILVNVRRMARRHRRVTTAGRHDRPVRVPSRFSLLLASRFILFMHCVFLTVLTLIFTLQRLKPLDSDLLLSATTPARNLGGSTPKQAMNWAGRTLNDEKSAEGGGLSTDRRSTATSDSTSDVPLGPSAPDGAGADPRMMSKLGHSSCPPNVLAEMTSALVASEQPVVGGRRRAVRSSSLGKVAEDVDSDEEEKDAVAKNKKNLDFFGRLREELGGGGGSQPRQQQSQEEIRCGPKEKQEQHQMAMQRHSTTISDVTWATTKEEETNIDGRGGESSMESMEARHDDKIKGRNQRQHQGERGRRRSSSKEEEKTVTHDNSTGTMLAGSEGACGLSESETFRARLEGLRRDLERSQRHLVEKEKLLETTEKQRDEIQKELKLVRAKLTKTRKERALLKKGKAKDEDELSMARTEIESVRESLTKTNSVKDTELSQVHNELAAIRERLEIAEAAADAKASLLTELEEEVERLNEDKSNQVSTIESLTSQKESQKDELDEMRKSLSVQQEQVKRLKLQAEAASSAAKAAEDIKQQKEDLESAIKTLTTQKNDLEIRQEDQLSKIATSKTVVLSLQTEIERLVKENAAQAEKIKQLSAAAQIGVDSQKQGAETAAVAPVQHAANTIVNVDGASKNGDGPGDENKDKEEEVGAETWLDIETALKDAPGTGVGAHEDDGEGQNTKRISLWRWSVASVGKKGKPQQDGEVASGGEQASPAHISSDEVNKLQEQVRMRDELIESLEFAAEGNKDTIARLKSDFVLLRSSYKMKEYSSRKEIERLEEEVALLNSELGQSGEQSMRRLQAKAAEAATVSPDKTIAGSEYSNDDSLEKTRTVVETWMQKTKASKNKKEAEELVESLQAEIIEMRAMAQLAASDKDDEIEMIRQEKQSMADHVKALESAFKAMNTVAQFNPGTSSDPQGAHVVTTVESLERLDQEIGALRTREQELETALQMQTMLLQEEKNKSAALKEALREAVGDDDIPL